MTSINKSFGDQCKCNHYEGEHQSIKKQASIESVTRDFSYIIPPGEWPSEFSRGKCNICNCIHFEPKKKKRWWGSK